MPLRHGILIAGVFSLVVIASPDPASAQQQKVNICRDGKGDAKIEACTDLIRRGGKDLESYYYYRSFGWEQKGECELAYSDAQQALSLKRDTENFGRMGTLEIDCKGAIDRAIEVYSNGIKAWPKSAALYLFRGVAYNKNADFERSQADFEQAIRLDPRDPDIYLRRGVLWADQEEFDKAIADYTKAIGLKPNLSDAYSYRGVAYGKKGDGARSLADHDRALKIDPKNADHYDNRAVFYREIGDYERALADHDKAIELAPNSVNYRGRVKTWILKGDLTRALADANESVRLDTGDLWSLLSRGMTYRYRGDHERALADFDKLLRRYPFDATTYVERGRTYERKGDLVRARADFERALKERGTLFRKAHEDARAQLAALDIPAAVPSATAKPSTVVTMAPPAVPSSAAPASRLQERRVALVIGNANYGNVSKLDNPSRDAAAVARSLRTIGFETVTVGNDMTREAMNNAFRNFARETEKADWAIVYYAGHGIEVGGVNYLIPIDAKLESDRDASFEAVSLDHVLTSVEGARKIKLVILDACRDNPFAGQMRRTVATRSIGRGLSRIEPEGATLVVYAAKHGQTALDGTGSNSPFASALIKRMAVPGVEINKVFRLIRDDVMEATAGRQEPFTYGSLPGREDFFFVAGK